MRNGSKKQADPVEIRNARRRSEYQNNAEYRRKIIETSRANYRERENVELFSCLTRLGSLSQFGASRQIFYDGENIGTSMLCFTTGELAELLGYSRPVMYRWRSKGMLPVPVFTALVEVENYSTVSQEVYLRREAEAIVKVIGAHQSQVRYYRQTDLDTIAALHTAVEAARAKIIG